MKYNIVHIHYDKKFLNESNKFNWPEVRNTIIYIGEKEEKILDYNKTLICFDKDDEDLKQQILQLCSASEMVVLYSLKGIFFNLINELPENITIAWRFFGFELYKRIENEFLTSKTISILRKAPPKRKNLLQKIRKIGSFLKSNSSQSKWIKAVKRIDLFLGLYKEEYDFLRIKFPVIPEKFIKLSIPPVIPKVLPQNYQKTIILIGNSRNSWNNHIDVLEILKTDNNEKKFQFLIPYNYGGNNFYSCFIEDFAKDIPNITFLYEFLKIEEYYEMYEKVCALVINAKRQMGVGNILIALANGVKIYLNEKNSFYSYLKNKNFIVYDMKEFERDYKNSNLSLTDEQKSFNYTKLLELESSYNELDFKKNIMDHLNGKNLIL